MIPKYPAKYIVGIVVGIVIVAITILESTSFYSIDAVSWMLTLGVLVVTVAGWRLSDGGRSPVFLFFVISALFLAGRALPVLYGEHSSIDVIGFGREFNVEPAVLTRYSALLLISLLGVYWGSLTVKTDIHEPHCFEYEARLYFKIFIAMIPVYLFKNVYYFIYIKSHGGYLAMYQGATHLDNVGAFARMGALVCMAAFVLYFFHESDRLRARRWMIVFFALFSIELLIGLRLKFFIIALAMYAFYKMRFKQRFSVREMLVTSAGVIAISIFIEVFREFKEQSDIQGFVLTGFLRQQGVSAGVLLSILQYEEVFRGLGPLYFIRQFLVPFTHAESVREGWFLADDLSAFMMPEAYNLGFGTGSSYIAELYLLGGVLAVFLGSLLIGAALSYGVRWSDGAKGSITFWIVTGILTYPRSMLQEPMYNLLKYGMITLILHWTVQFLKRTRAERKATGAW